MEKSSEQVLDNPRAQALRNPDILEEIFKHESVKGKDLRLVCKLWNEIIISLPNPKLCFNLKHSSQDICCDSAPFQLFSVCMEPKLARKIKLEQETCSEEEPLCSYAVLATKSVLVHACDVFNDHIKYMDLVFVDDDLFPVLYKILLESNQCPNLKEIRIAEITEFDNDGYPLSSTTPPTLKSDIKSLPPRPKLVSIYLQVHQLSTTTSLCILGQLLINCAPNLARLELSSYHYFPDLTKCSNLVALHVARGPLLYLIKFDLFSRMLTQVAAKLEVLLIGCKDSLFPETEHPVAVDESDFEMPGMMPRLKSFRNEYMDAYNCGDGLKDITGKRCPNLRNVRLAFCVASPTSTDDLLKRMGEHGTTFSFGNAGVTSLSLDWIGDPASFNYLKTSFPYLKKLEILNEELTLGPLFKACSPLGLTHLDVNFDKYPETLSEFVDCFVSNEELFKTLKVLSITRDQTPTCLHGQDDLIGNPEGMNLMKKFVLSMVEMQSVVIWYPMFEKKFWWVRILPCILENNIPIEFKRWPERDEHNQLRFPNNV